MVGLDINWIGWKPTREVRRPRLEPPARPNLQRVHTNGQVMMAHDDAPGWAAIESAVAQVVPAQTPLHWGTKDALPGQTSIWGLSAYRTDEYWLLVTFGLTDLFDKADGEDPKISGWGFELTMRVPMTSDQPPAWALVLIEKLGRYVYQSGQPFAHGHWMEPGGPITGRLDTRLTAVAFATDPQLPRITSQNGSSIFLTVVGISAE